MSKQILHYNKAIYGEPEKKAIMEVLDSDFLSGGVQSRRLEEELADWWGIRYVILVGSGSAANFIATQALGMEEGKEVIVPAGGVFPTTISPLYYHNLIPRFVDISLKDFCLDLDQVEAVINERTGAIIVPHTLGFMPDMERLMSIAQENELQVLEDTCDAMGSKQNGKKAGTFGNLATVSFYPAHLMTTLGEGGAILTNDRELYRLCYSIRDWGRACTCQADRLEGSDPACGDRFGAVPGHDHRYYYINPGLNLKLTEAQAAFGRAQLRRVDRFIDLRKRNFQILAGKLDKDDFFDPEITPFAFPILTRQRAKVMVKLHEEGIGVRTVFAGNILEHPLMNKIKHIADKGRLINSDRLFREGFFVGVGPHLTPSNMHRIADNLIEALSEFNFEKERISFKKERIVFDTLAA